MLWSYCYSLYVSSVLIIAFLSSIVIYLLKRNKASAMKFLLLGFFIFVVSIPFNLRQYNLRGEELQKRVNNSIELTTREKLGVYGCIIMIMSFDAIPFPEASEENFYLLFPVDGKKRTFYSNSMLNSPSIMRAIKTGQKGQIGWNKWDFVLNKGFRYIVAFDPCTIETVTKNSRTDVTLSTYFSYRKNYPTVHATNILHGWFTFRVEEGLFWYLQEKGWLHPYTAIWKANLTKL